MTKRRSVYSVGGRPGAAFTLEGAAVVVGDDETESRTGMRLPVRNSLSSRGWAVL